MSVSIVVVVVVVIGFGNVVTWIYYWAHWQRVKGREVGEGSGGV